MGPMKVDEYHRSHMLINSRSGPILYAPGISNKKKKK